MLQTEDSSNLAKTPPISVESPNSTISDDFLIYLTKSKMDFVSSKVESWVRSSSRKSSFDSSTSENPLPCLAKEFFDSLSANKS